jgi:hypothetical protein
MKQKEPLKQVRIYQKEHGIPRSYERGERAVVKMARDNGGEVVAVYAAISKLIEGKRCLAIVGHEIPVSATKCGALQN